MALKVQFKVQKWHLGFFIHNASAVDEDNPLPLFLADDCLFATGNDVLHRVLHFIGNQIIALISFLSPFNRTIGVSVQLGLNPPMSP